MFTGARVSQGPLTEPLSCLPPLPQRRCLCPAAPPPPTHMSAAPRFYCCSCYTPGGTGPERRRLWLSTPWLREVLLNARMTGVQSVSRLWEAPRVQGRPGLPRVRLVAESGAASPDGCSASPMVAGSKMAPTSRRQPGSLRGGLRPRLSCGAKLGGLGIVGPQRLEEP